MSDTTIAVEAIASHLNGIYGKRFHAVIFTDDTGEGSRKVGIVTEDAGECYVLDIAKLAAGDVAFGSNSWRGDTYEQSLRKAIQSYEENR